MFEQFPVSLAWRELGPDRDAMRAFLGPGRGFNGHALTLYPANQSAGTSAGAGEGVHDARGGRSGL